MKNTAMNSSFIGSTLDLMMLTYEDWETISPMTKAPMAMDSPMLLEMRAEVKHRATAKRRSISPEYLLPTQSRSLGMHRAPRTMMMETKRTMSATIPMVDWMVGDSPLSRGAARVRMITCPMSSSTVIPTAALATWVPIIFRLWSTPTTTAVLVPDMMAPRNMEVTGPRPSIMPTK